jgi:hypothetical protein
MAKATVPPRRDAEQIKGLLHSPEVATLHRCPRSDPLDRPSRLPHPHDGGHDPGEVAVGAADVDPDGSPCG